MTELTDIQEALKKALPSLPRTLQLAATYMLDHPGDIATLSMRKVAESAGVSAPNFDRLAKKVGFGTYSELREIYQQRVQKNDITDYHLRAQLLQKSGKEGGQEAVWADFRDSALTSIAKVYDTIGSQDVDHIVETLRSSPKIFVTGGQSSRSFATYLNYVGAMTSSQFQLLGRTGGLFADDLADLAPGDALIAIAIRPCARATVEIARIAQERGCAVVGITDSQASPLALYCDHLLIAPTESPLFFESYLGVTAIIELLIAFYTMSQGDTAITRMENIEADRLRLREYWNDRNDKK